MKAKPRLLKYTRVVKIGGKWNAYLEIGNQGFCFCEQTTKKRAQWHAKMLRHALRNLIEMEIKAARVTTPRPITKQR